MCRSNSKDYGFHLRLDFEQFTTLGPADTVETNGGACVDSFTVTVSYDLKQN